MPLGWPELPDVYRMNATPSAGAVSSILSGENSQRVDDIQPHEAFEHILRTDPVVVENDGSKLCLACDQRVALLG